MEKKRILLLNGSPRKKGTSFSFARTIKILAENKGCQADIIHILDYFDGREDINSLKELMEQADILAVSAPLYADTLPYADIWFLERLAALYGKELQGKGFFAVGQCGFPDITRIEPLLECCKYFAQETGMNWMGGLAYGGGGMIDGKHMEELGKKGERITEGFRLALDNVMRGDKIPVEAQELLNFRIPRLLFGLLAAFLNSKAGKLAKESGNPDYGRKVYLG
ncbi:MAG: flavodoxin family protein [Pseudomonadota bacterium]